VAGGVAVRMDQASAGLSVLQLPGAHESARRMANVLRGVNPEEDRRRDLCLTATTDRATQQRSARERSGNPKTLLQSTNRASDDPAATPQSIYPQLVRNGTKVVKTWAYPH
jgi:hypothetical protein